MPDEDKDKRTAQPGSDPGKDTATPGAEPGKKEGASDAGTPPAGDKELPFDKHPKWQAARKAEKFLEDLMDANDLESVEDLVSLVESGKSLKTIQVTPDQLEGLIKKSQTLEKYEAYWKDQDEKKRRDLEEPSQTVARLEKQVEELKSGQKTKEEAAKKVQEAKKLWENYDSEVTKIFDVMEDIPADARKFYTLFMGVNNPASSVDFTNKKAIKEAAQEARKTVDSIMEYAIKQFVDGKRKIPTVPPVTPAASETPKIKNLREARKIMIEHASKFP